MTRMMYWNCETAKMAKFSKEATGSSSSVHTSPPQYLKSSVRNFHHSQIMSLNCKDCEFKSVDYGPLLNDASIIESSLQRSVLIASILVVKWHKPGLTLGVEKDSNLSSIMIRLIIGWG